METTQQLRKNTALWIVIVIALFIVAITLGIIMRLNQGEVMHLAP